MTDKRALSPRSILAQIDHYLDPANGAVAPPIQPATTFARGADHELLGAYTYARTRSPSDDLAERIFAQLDGGAEARLFGSGMAAVTSLFEIVDSGRHIVAPRVMYHTAQDWLRRISARRGIGLDFFDASDPAALARAVRPGETDIVWTEVATNPNWEVIDLAAAAEAAHAAGALLGVDATVAPPVTTRALALGADFVFHSATKYLNGHSDVTAGVLVAAVADARWEEVKLVRNLTGGMLGPFEAWLLLRGLRTLALRFDQASRSALEIARHFEGHPKLEAVLYPGLESHPGHAVAARQMTGGFGGMLSITVKGGAAEARAVATGTRLFIPATSLGGVESLIEHRATVEGPQSVVAANLLRLSVGIEETADLIADLEQALAKI